MDTSTETEGRRMKQFAVVLLIMLVTPLCYSEDTIGVITNVMGSVTFSFNNETGEANPGWEIPRGTTFSGSLGNRIWIGTTEGIKLISAFPYAHSAAKMSDKLIENYIQLVGGTTVMRSRGTPSEHKDSIFTTGEELIELLDALSFNLLENGFSIEFSPGNGETNCTLSDSKVICYLYSEAEITSISYETRSHSRYQEESVVLGMGELLRTETGWFFSFHEYDLFFPDTEYRTNITTFTVNYEDKSDQLEIEFKVPTEIFIKKIEEEIITATIPNPTNFTKTLTRASVLMKYGFNIEALTTLQNAGIDLGFLLFTEN